MSLAVAVARTRLFPNHPDPVQCHGPEIWTRLQPVGCVPLLTQHLPPHSTRILQPAEPEVVGACCRPHAALSCPKPGVNLCGVGKGESQSVPWDKGVEMEMRMRNRDGPLQGIGLCRKSHHQGGGLSPLCTESVFKMSLARKQLSSSPVWWELCMPRCIPWWKTAPVVVVEGEAHQFGEGNGKRGARSRLVCVQATCGKMITVSSCQRGCNSEKMIQNMKE